KSFLGAVAGHLAWAGREGGKERCGPAPRLPAESEKIALFEDQGLGLGVEDLGRHHLPQEQGMVPGAEGVFKLEVQVGVSLGQDGGPGGAVVHSRPANLSTWRPLLKPKRLPRSAWPLSRTLMAK